MQPHEANTIAVGGHTKAVRDALLRLGMRRCSLALVYRQTRPPEGLRLDWYSIFLRWLRALWLAHRAGAEFLLDDLHVRVAAWRERDGEGQGRDCWRAQMVRCEAEHSDVVRAALVSDLRQMRVEAVECIAAQRQLIARIDAELGETAQAA